MFTIENKLLKYYNYQTAFIFMLFCILCAGCSTDNSTTIRHVTGDKPSYYHQLKLDKQLISIPKNWKPMAASSSMKLMEYYEVSDTSLKLSIYHFGPNSGTPQMNMDRWKKQLDTVTMAILEKKVEHIAYFEIEGIKNNLPTSIYALMIQTQKGPYFIKMMDETKKTTPFKELFFNIFSESDE